MTLDTTVKITDLIMIVALILGPIIAVQLTEMLRTRQDDRKRRVHIFRTLMATRAIPLHQKHVESLNLVEFEFDPAHPQYGRLADTFRLYIAHLNDTASTDVSHWEMRRKELLTSCLFEMSKCLGYHYNESQIHTGAYTPKGWFTANTENEETRKLWLEVLQGGRALPLKPYAESNSTAPLAASATKPRPPM